jgi:hypothetical protein
MQVRSFTVALAVWLASSAAAPVAAQSAPVSTDSAPRVWRIVAGIGFGRVYDDEGSLGSGPEVSGGVGFRLTRTWSIEGVVSRHRHERNDAFRVDSHATSAVGRLVAHVGREDGPARLFLSAGGGVVRHAGTVSFAGGPPVPPAAYEATGALLELGVGVDIAASQRWFIRPGVQVRVSKLDRPTFGPEPPYSTGLATVTVGWRR